MKSNKTVEKIADCIFDLLNPASRFEDKLREADWYPKNSVASWKKQLSFRSKTTDKILEQIKIFTAPEIQNLIKTAVSNHPEIFAYEHCFIMRLGEPGKSGEMIMYHFRRASNSITRFENFWEIPNFPSESRIVFVDDIIGSGQQSLGFIDYLKDKVSSVFNSSHQPYLFTICGTPTGIKNVLEQTTFGIVCAFILDDSKFNYYHESNAVFSSEEREQMRQLNERLGEQAFFAQGLLVAFYFTTPDNTMRFIWDDKRQYEDEYGRKKLWAALLPKNVEALAR
jgi:hypothetical protein